MAAPNAARASVVGLHKIKESAVHLIALAPFAIALAMVIKGRRW